MYQPFEQFRKSPQFNTKNYEKGHAAEKELLGTIREYFADPPLSLTPEGHSFDYESPTRLVELKTRTNRRLAYPDTAIGSNKMRFELGSTKEIIFVFSFVDGLYFWKYNTKVKLREGAIFGVPHTFIPVKLLSPVSITLFLFQRTTLGHFYPL